MHGHRLVVFSIYTVQLESFQLLTHLTSAVCLCGASVGIIFTRLHLLFEEYLLFSFFSRKLALFACKTSHSEARHGDCVDCNLPAHTVIWLHVVLVVDCDVKGVLSVCHPYFPSTPGVSQSVDRKREWLKCLIHIWFSYCVHTRLHTPVKPERPTCLWLFWQNSVFSSWKRRIPPWLGVQPPSCPGQWLSHRQG